MHAFLCHETNFFCVSTTSGLLHDVFQFVSVHPIPIEICYGLLSYAKLLVCCADSLFGLDVRSNGCVVLSSLQVPPHFFTQKSSLSTSGIRNVAMTFFGGVLHVLGLTGRRLSLRLDPTGREFPSPLVTVFDVPIASMRASGIHSTDTVCKKKLGL